MFIFNHEYASFSIILSYAYKNNGFPFRWGNSIWGGKLTGNFHFVKVFFFLQLYIRPSPIINMKFEFDESNTHIHKWHYHLNGQCLSCMHGCHLSAYEKKFCNKALIMHFYQIPTYNLWSITRSVPYLLPV